MAKLNKEQAEQLAELERLRDAPDDDGHSSRHEGRNVDIYIDLSDEAAVDRAIGLGLLTRAEADKLDDGDDGDDDGDGGGKRKREPKADDAPDRGLDKRYR